MIGFAIFAAKKGQSALSCVNKLIQMGFELSVIPRGYKGDHRDYGL